MNILLDYFFKIVAIEPTPAASTAFLKQVCILVSPKEMVTPGTITECVTMEEVGALTDNDEAQQLFNAGMTKVLVLPLDTLSDFAAAVVGHESDFFTVLVSSDFADADIDDEEDGLDLGQFAGVVGIASDDDTKNATRAALTNYVAFHTTSTNKAKNMFYAFGKMLSNTLNWRNQQYISMPVADDVDTNGDADSLFDDRISFVLNDDQYGKRLAFFGVGGKAIIAPYVKKNLAIDMQSAALTYVSANQPQFTKKEAALLEDELKKVIQSYIDRNWIEAGTVEISLVENNFVAAGEINITEPSAMWRISAEILQTL